MNQREIQAMQIENDRRCTESRLRQILMQTPVIIIRSKGSRLRARMGLGRIIYIEPVKGYVKNIKLGSGVQEDSSRTDNSHYVFNYQGVRFDVKYNPH